MGWGERWGADFDFIGADVPAEDTPGKRKSGGGGKTEIKKKRKKRKKATGGGEKREKSDNFVEVRTFHRYDAGNFDE